jgi:hypothetical protein
LKLGLGWVGLGLHCCPWKLARMTSKKEWNRLGSGLASSYGRRISSELFGIRVFTYITRLVSTPWIKSVAVMDGLLTALSVRKGD